MPLTVELGKLRIVVTAPDFKLTPEQEHAIADWWKQRLDHETKQLLGVPE